jgi:hypothetical protein
VGSWYALAGWLNHPVVTIDHIRPSSYHEASVATEIRNPPLMVWSL